MRANSIIFWILGIFFLLASAGYTVWNVLSSGHIEWFGSIVLLLSAVFAVFIGFFLQRTYFGQGGELPEDRLDAEIDDADPEMGHFSPWSWWPFILAASVAVIALGMAVGFWICFIGVPLLLIALIGWVYEYYRGNFAR